MRNLALKNKYFPHFRILLKAGRQASVGKGNFSHIIEASLKRVQRKQQEYNDIDWKISITETSCHLLEWVNLNFTLITTIFAFKRKKCEKVRVVKAHIGGKIMTFIVQDLKKNIQPGASDSNSESATDSYRVKQ